jgi:hypothetical protein
MRGRNTVSCEACKHGPAPASGPEEDAGVALQIQLLEAPRYLRLHLIRHGKDDVKIQDPVEVDEELNLGAITDGRRPGRYRLAGIIYHLGISMQSGHYKAEFRDEEGRWWKADDTMVRPAAGPATGVGQGGRQEQQRAKKDAYYLIYERVDGEGQGEGQGEQRVPTEEEVKALIPPALRVRDRNKGGHVCPCRGATAAPLPCLHLSFSFLLLVAQSPLTAIPFLSQTPTNHARTHGTARHGTTGGGGQGGPGAAPQDLLLHPLPCAH